LPDGLRAEIKRLLVEALVADVMAYPNLAEGRESTPATVGTGRGRARGLSAGLSPARRGRRPATVGSRQDGSRKP
jgi:hypothetical protein